MKKKLIGAGLAASLLIAVIAGGAVMAAGGEPGQDEVHEEVTVHDVDASAMSVANHDLDLTAPDELSVRVAELLETDLQATHDALVAAEAAASPKEGKEVEQNAESMSVQALGPSYLEYGSSVGAILGLDGRRVAEAIAKAYEELYAVERGIGDHGSGWDKDDGSKKGDVK